MNNVFSELQLKDSGDEFIRGLLHKKKSKLPDNFISCALNFMNNIDTKIGLQIFSTFKYDFKSKDSFRRREGKF